MSIIDWFNKNKLQETDPSSSKLDIPGDLWVKCKKCTDSLYLKDLENNQKVCPTKCNHHFRLTPEERIKIHFDENSFEEIESKIEAVDFLKFEDTEKYEIRLQKAKKQTKHKDAILIGTAKLNHLSVNVGIMNFSFMGGSMGQYVGEAFKIGCQKAVELNCPFISIASSGGARMQEGLVSLMQLPKTVAACNLLDQKKIPFISILTHPTTGGVSASFAMLGDIIIAEKGSMIGFAGKRVIEETIKEQLPEDFQTAEYLLEHGMIDMVVHRKELNQSLSKVLSFVKK